MRKITGIICEYNPFHNGHAWQIQQARQMGATHILCVMSGDFVQRGSPALFPRHVRAKAALSSGADLVVQLPTVYAMARAERFAYGAMSILDRLGCVDAVHFGSECGDIRLLRQAAQAVLDPRVLLRTKERMKSGEAFAPARMHATAELFSPKIAELLANPNDTLAVEYLKWLIRLKSPIQPETVLRKGVRHEQMQPQDGFASASLLRESFQKRQIESLSPYVPEPAMSVYRQAVQEGRIFLRRSELDAAALFCLRGKSKRELADAADCAEGLHNRIYEAVRDSPDYITLLSLLAAKRYPNARLRRILLSACLGIREQDAHQPPPCAKILGFNRRGQEILRVQNTSPGFFLRSKSAELERLSPSCQRFVQIEDLAQNLYSIGLCALDGSRGEFLDNPVIIRQENDCMEV